MVFALAVGFYLGLLALPAFYDGPELIATAQVSDRRLAEPSGLVASSRNPGYFWTHNDSGGKPELYAVNAQGEVSPRRFTVQGAEAIDWEAITRREDKIFVADMGNNFNKRQDLGVYEVEEPSLEDPESLTARFLPIAYPDQSEYPPAGSWDFDCEAVFCWGRHLYFLTKNRPGGRLWVQAGSCHLYRLDTERTDSKNILTKVDSKSDLQGWVTGAEISPDGRWLALVCESPVQSIWLFEQPLEGDRFLSEPASIKRFIFKGGGQVESLAFASADTILLLNEGGQLFELSLTEFKAETLNR